MFPLNRHLTERLGFSFISVVAILTVIPIVGVVVYILYEGGPAISWEFLSAVPRGGMREGGILPAIIGTIYLTIGTAPFGPTRLLAIYLSDTPIPPDPRIRIAIITGGIPGGLWSLRVRLFVLFLRLGTRSWRLPTLYHDAPGHH
jgi:phosphate transport system permease protein